MNSYYQTGGIIPQPPSNEKPHNGYAQNMTYPQPGAGLSGHGLSGAGACLSAGGVGHSGPGVGLSGTGVNPGLGLSAVNQNPSIPRASAFGSVPAAGAYQSMTHGARPMAPTAAYMSPQQYQASSTLASAAAYRSQQPHYAAPRYSVSPIPSPSYPMVSMPHSYPYPASSYMAAHGSLSSPGSGIPGYAMPAAMTGASLYAAPPSVPLSPYQASVPGMNSYPAGMGAQIRTSPYPGAPNPQYPLPRP